MILIILGTHVLVEEKEENLYYFSFTKKKKDAFSVPEHDCSFVWPSASYVHPVNQHSRMASTEGHAIYSKYNHVEQWLSDDQHGHLIEEQTSKTTIIINGVSLWS